MKKKQEEISKMILNHLRENPDAGDTLEGISEWWLNSERIETSVDEVANALECLIEKGLVRRLDIVDSSSIYKIYKKD